MATIVEKLENITATEGDDYFTVDYKVDLLNRAKLHIIRLGINLERGQPTSFRFLDPLRSTQELSFGTFELYLEDYPDKGSYIYKSEVDLPTDYLVWLSLQFDKKIHLKELRSLYELHFGNAVPNKHEGYFLVFNDKFQFYLHDNSSDYDNLTLRYIKQHTPIQKDDSSIGDVFEAEDVILYYAAILMSNTDWTLPMEQIRNKFNELYKDLK